MKKLSFQTQLELTLFVIVMCILGAMAMQSAAVIHFGFILVGIVFLLNPIAPPQWASSRNVELSIRLMAVVVILLGIFTL